MKKGQLTQEFGKLLIAVAILLIIIGLIIVFFGKGEIVLNRLKELFTYG